jgi:chemotaxis protein MotB
MLTHGLKMACRRIAGVFGVMLIGTLVAPLGGCVGQGQYDNMYETNRSLQGQLGERTRERDEALRSLELLRNQGLGGEKSLAALQSQNDELKRQLDAALANYKALESQLAGLNFGKLDVETNEALEELARQYPDLIKFDSERGMLRFASDLTFDSGSDVVSSGARSALGALSGILNKGTATQYEVVVEGHTDSQRISPRTAAKHPTNRHLSAHRAISVIEAMASTGVARDRMLAQGWGEYRPAVPNTGSGNTPANRRVEIYLAKARPGSVPPPADAPAAPRTGASNPDRKAPPAKPMDLTK